jgi:hypothetical protein
VLTGMDRAVRDMKKLIQDLGQAPV